MCRCVLQADAFFGESLVILYRCFFEVRKVRTFNAKESSFFPTKNPGFELMTSIFFSSRSILQGPRIIFRPFVFSVPSDLIGEVGTRVLP